MRARKTRPKDMPTQREMIGKLSIFGDCGGVLVEEHVPYSDQLLVDLVWVAREDDALRNHTLRRRRQRCASGDEL